MESYLDSRRFLSNTRVFSGVPALHSFILNKEDVIFCFGQNDYGQLGIGDSKYRTGTNIVKFFDVVDSQVKQISCGHSHTIFLLQNGQLFSCGSNSSGELGLGDTLERHLPVRITSLRDMDIIDVSCGYGTSYCLSSSGIIYSFGWNDYGQLGLYSDVNILSPSSVEFPTGVKIVLISAGLYHAAAMGEDGLIWTWGVNRSGQLGRDGEHSVPKLVHLGSSPHKNVAVRVLCGGNHTTVVVENNTIFSFGYNRDGQLGIGNTENQLYPVKNVWFENKKVKKVVLGSDHTIAFLESGQLVGYGMNRHFQLTQESKKGSCIPSVFSFTSIEGSPVVDIVCGFVHTLLLTFDGQCFGVGCCCINSTYLNDKYSVPTIIMNGLGRFHIVHSDILNYISEEQKVKDDELRTTDMIISMRNMSEKRLIWVNKLVFRAKCANYKKCEEIFVEECNDATKDSIIKLIYEEYTGNVKIATKQRNILGIRSISLYKILKQLYLEKEQNGDVRITSDGEEVYFAHKFVLVARTSYFRSIYRGKWKEASTGTFHLEMQLNRSFELWLKYIYTGDVDDTFSKDINEIIEYCEYFGVNNK